MPPVRSQILPSGRRLRLTGCKNEGQTSYGWFTLVLMNRLNLGVPLLFRWRGNVVLIQLLSFISISHVIVPSPRHVLLYHVIRFLLHTKANTREGTASVSTANYFVRIKSISNLYVIYKHLYSFPWPVYPAISLPTWHVFVTEYKQTVRKNVYIFHHVRTLLRSFNVVRVYVSFLCPYW